MAKTGSTRKLTPEAAAYIAGLIDGEGTITLTRNHVGENRRLAVSVANTELPLLQFLIDHIGVGKITRKCVVSDRHTPSYCYAIASRQALALLVQVVPYLRSYKRQRAELVLEQYLRVTPRSGKYTVALRADRTRFEQALLGLTAKPTARGPSRCREPSARVYTARTSWISF